MDGVLIIINPDITQLDGEIYTIIIIMINGYLYN